MRQFRREAAGRREGGGGDKVDWSKGSSNLCRKTRQGILGKGIKLLLEAAGRRVGVSNEQRMIPQAERIGWKRMTKGVCMESGKRRK